MEGCDLRLSTETYTTKRMYILGKATNGPTNEPIQITNKKQCIGIFGNSDLTQTWHEAYQVTKDSIEYFCIRINGEEATLTIKGQNNKYDKYDAFTLKSYCSGELWSNTKVVFSETCMKIINPSAIGGYIEIDFDKFPTIGQIVEVVNLAFQRGMIGVKASTQEYFKPSTDIARAYRYMYGDNIYMMGGDDELNFTKNELHELLEVTYNIIEGQPIDVIVVSGIYFDDISPMSYYNDTEFGSLFYASNRDYLSLPHEEIEGKPATFHGQLIQFCKSQMSHAIVTHGVIALNPVENVEDFISESAYATKIASSTCLYDRHDLVDTEGNKDNGRFISIVLGDFEYVDIDGNAYYNNGYAGYGALLTAMNTPESLTNKVIPNIARIRYYLDDEELQLVSKMGVTAFRWSALGNALVVNNGVTASLNTSPYHVVSNLRMIQLIVSSFKHRMDEYVGSNLTELIQSNAMQKSADELVSSILETKIVKDLKAKVTISLTGVAIIDLQILATYSIEYVQATGTIKL